MSCAHTVDPCILEPETVADRCKTTRPSTCLSMSLSVCLDSRHTRAFEHLVQPLLVTLLQTRRKASNERFILSGNEHSEVFISLRSSV
jgi:hypothetical protein